MLPTDDSSCLSFFRVAAADGFVVLLGTGLMGGWLSSSSSSGKSSSRVIPAIGVSGAEISDVLLSRAADTRTDPSGNSFDYMIIALSPSSVRTNAIAAAIEGAE